VVVLIYRASGGYAELLDAALGERTRVPRDALNYVLMRIVAVNEDRGGRYPVAVVLRWDGSRRALERAHRLPAIAHRRAMLRAENVLGFWLIGEPDDPPGLTVLDVRAGAASPTPQHYSQWVIRWPQLPDFLRNTDV
jgi:hypothetical protein